MGLRDVSRTFGGARSAGGDALIQRHQVARVVREDDSDDLPSVADAIRRDQIVSHFQPLASVRSQVVVGLEALARYKSSHECRETSADGLFRAAARENIIAELERHCCKTAIQGFARLPQPRRGLVLFLNLGSWITLDPEQGLVDLRQLVRDAGLVPQSIVIEVLEERIEDVGLLQRLARNLRASGFLLALDDVGKGHSNLDRVALIRPDVLKCDRTLISNVSQDFHKQETIKSLVGLSRRIGSVTVAEGVETEDEAIAVLELGVDILQGYFIGRPQPDASLGRSTEDAGRAIALLAGRFKTSMIKKIHRQTVQHRFVAAVAKDVVERLAARTPDEFDSALEDVIRVHPDIECLYVLDREGMQATDAVVNASMIRRRRTTLFPSTAKGADHSLMDYFYGLLETERTTFTTGPQVSLASGSVSRIMSVRFLHQRSDSPYVLCMETAGHT